MEGYEPAYRTQAELLRTSPDEKRRALFCWAAIVNNRPDHPLKKVLHDCCAQYLAAMGHDHRLLTEVTYVDAQGRSEQLSSRVEYAYGYYDPLFAIAPAPPVSDEAPAQVARASRPGRKPSDNDAAVYRAWEKYVASVKERAAPGKKRATHGDFLRYLRDTKPAGVAIPKTVKEIGKVIGRYKKRIERQLDRQYVGP